MNKGFGPDTRGSGTGNQGSGTGKPIRRRRFITGLSLAAAGSIVAGGCRDGSGAGGSSGGSGVGTAAAVGTAPAGTNEAAPGTGASGETGTGPSFREELEKNREMPADLLHRLLDQKADHYMNLSWHCAQSSFLALKEQFALEGDQVVKALTPLAGIAERGETCGAVIGPLMAMGLIFGRDQNRLGDWDTYRNSLVPSGAFCAAFEARYGSTMCHGVQEEKFGRCYRLTDPGELAEFQKAGATDHCSEVVRSAVRLAADIILEHTAS